MKLKNKAQINFILLILFSFVIRLLFSIYTRSFQSDLYTFLRWAEELYESGFKDFYSPGYNDYPPGYMYILRMIGGILKHVDSSNYMLVHAILKMPSMLCDIFSALIIYKLASENTDSKKSLVILALYLFNPAVIMNSSVWGQVDSILAFMVLLTVYFMYKRKMCLSYLIFCLGIIFKPQILFIAPIMLMGIVDNVFIKNFSIKKLVINLSAGIASLLFAILLCIPFNLHHVIEQYTNTVTQFPYATMNAYNFWAMLDLNWVSQDKNGLFGLPLYIWGYISIITVCFFAFMVWLYLALRKKKRAHTYFYLAAFIIIGIFSFSVRMHERYMFPALALVLSFCAIENKIKYFTLYVSLSIIHFFNVYQIYDHYFKGIDKEHGISEIICGMYMVICFVYMIYLAYGLVRNKKIKNKSKNKSY